MNSWLQNLKVGDKVFVVCRTGTYLRTVDKITPKGNIKVNGIMFNSNGTERGGDLWNRCSLSEATPEELKIFNEKLIIKKALTLMHNTAKITLEQAHTIIKLLEKPTKKGGAE